MLTCNEALTPVALSVYPYLMGLTSSHNAQHISQTYDAWNDYQKHRISEFSHQYVSPTSNLQFGENCNSYFPRARNVTSDHNHQSIPSPQPWERRSPQSSMPISPAASFGAITHEPLRYFSGNSLIVSTKSTKIPIIVRARGQVRYTASRVSSRYRDELREKKKREKKLRKILALSVV